MFASSILVTKSCALVVIVGVNASNVILSFLKGVQGRPDEGLLLGTLSTWPFPWCGLSAPMSREIYGALDAEEVIHDSASGQVRQAKTKLNQPVNRSIQK